MTLAESLARKAAPCEKRDLPLKCGDTLGPTKVLVAYCPSCVLRPAIEATIEEAIRVERRRMVWQLDKLYDADPTLIERHGSWFREALLTDDVEDGG